MTPQWLPVAPLQGTIRPLTVSEWQEPLPAVATVLQKILSAMQSSPTHTSSITNDA
jgi:hypothetical protein